MTIIYHCDDCDFETDDSAKADEHTRETDHSVSELEREEP